MWFFMLNSGIHSTITGILLAITIPFKTINGISPAAKLEHRLVKPVSFFILPLFALFNTAIIIDFSMFSNLLSNGSLGIFFGLVFGKPIGITFFTYLSHKFKIAKLPDKTNFMSIIGVGALGGIGFTMSIFISLLAFDDINIINQMKFAILISSLISGLIGYLILKFIKINVIQTKKD